MEHRTEGELQSWLDAELEGSEALEVAEHLMVCTDCRARLGDLRLAGERLRMALAELEIGSVESRAAVTTASPRRLREASGRLHRTGRRSLMRAAALLLVAAGAAAAVVPGSPLRQLIDRFAAAGVEPPVVEMPVSGSELDTELPGIASITVAPAGGHMELVVRGFPATSTLTVRYGAGSEVSARLLSGESGARFSAGPGSLYVIGSGGSDPARIVIELPRGLESATLDVDGKREVTASRDGIRRAGESDGIPHEEVVLRVGG